MNLFFRFTLDVATDFIFGTSVDSLDDPRVKFATAFAEVQRVQQQITVAGCVYSPPFFIYPSLRLPLHVSLLDRLNNR